MTGRRFFTSDLHLGHANIIIFCNRPYMDVEEMNEDIVRRYNEVVGYHDEVWILGDLCMGKLPESLRWVKKMHGTKYLVPGNHDRMFKCQGQKYANTVQHYLDAGIDKVTENEVMISQRGHDADGKAIPEVLACHFPFVGDHSDQTEDRFQEYRPQPRKNLLLVHGHTHGVWRKNKNMIDVGVDAWGGYPVSFEDVGTAFREPPEYLNPLKWI